MPTQKQYTVVTVVSARLRKKFWHGFETPWYWQQLKGTIKLVVLI